MTRPFKTVSAPLLGLLLLVAALPSTACEGFEPTRFPVGDTVVLFSLARAEYMGERSGFDFAGPQAVVVERPKDQSYEDFDVAFSEEDGQFVMLPAGMFEGFRIEPGIVAMDDDVTFETLNEAPSEDYVTDEAVPLAEGAVYAVRTRQQGACSQYAKFEVLDLDAEGILEFRFLRNNLCNDRNLTDRDPDD